jgi:hypothetical protein
MVLTIGSLWGGAPSACAQGVADRAISGRVLDPGGAPLRGVGITLAAADERVVRVATTNADGEFRITGIPAGVYQLRARLLGYEPVEREIDLVEDALVELELRLQIAAVVLEAVEVRARRDADRERSRFDTEAGVTARVIGGDDLRLVPGLAEADVLRAVELLPGVVSTTDFSSAFNVRGGSADQNLILLDGFPIFNPFHLGGLFSVFNADVVARAELLAGGFGAEHGGRVSSVLDVESVTPGDDADLRIAGGVSLLSSRISLQSGLPDALGTVLGGSGGDWFVAARRSYFDILLRPFVDFPYHLADAQGQLSLGTRGDGRLRFTFYSGDDVLDLSSADGEGEIGLSSLRLGWRWGNDLVGAHWSQPLRHGWLSDTRVGYSRYRDGLSLLDFEDTHFSSRVSLLFLRSELRRELGPLSLRTGAELGRLRYANQAEAGGAEFLSTADDGVLGAAFISGRWRPETPWLVEGGVRMDGWRPQGRAVGSLSPRLAAKRFLGARQETAVKVAVGRYTQVLQSLRNEEFPLSNDLWIAAGPDVPHVVSDQIQVGMEAYLTEDWYLSAEAYHRRFRGIVEFNPADDPNDPGDDLVTGRGLSRGVDFLLRGRSGPVSGWATLSLLRANRWIPDTRSGLIELEREEVQFPPHWDRRANLHLVLLAELPRRFEGSLRWSFGSGLPYTRPVAQHLGWEYDFASGRYRVPSESFGSEEPEFVVVLGDRNAERYPSYHRLDLMLRRTFEPRGATVTPYLQVLNAYNRKNVLFHFYNFDRSPPTRSGLSMFPVLPTIGVEVAF